MPSPDQLKKTKEVDRPGILLCVARQPNLPKLFFGSSDAKVHAIDMAEEKPEAKEYVGHASYVTGLALCGGSLISGGYDCALIWWNAETGEKLREVKDAHAKWIRRLAASPDGKLVASVADDMVCRLWDAESGQMVRELRGHQETTPHHYPSMLYAVSFSADGRCLATGDKLGHCVVWDVAEGKEIAAVDAPVMYTWDPKQRRHSIGGVRSLAFSPDGKLLAAGGIGTIENIDHLGGPARLEVFDWQAGQRTHEFAGDNRNGLVQQLAFHPGGEWLLGAGGDNGGFLRFWHLPDNKVLKTEEAPMHVHDFVLNEAADAIYTVGHGKIVKWELG